MDLDSSVARCLIQGNVNGPQSRRFHLMLVSLIGQLDVEQDTGLRQGLYDPSCVSVASQLSAF